MLRQSRWRQLECIELYVSFELLIVCICWTFIHSYWQKVWSKSSIWTWTYTSFQLTHSHATQMSNKIYIATIPVNQW